LRPARDSFSPQFQSSNGESFRPESLTGRFEFVAILARALRSFTDSNTN